MLNRLLTFCKNDMNWAKVEACSLDETTHRYTVAGVSPKHGSVTSLVGKHFAKFDAANTCSTYYTRWATSSTSKYYKHIAQLRSEGVDDASIQQSITKEWTNKGKAAADAGTHLHKQIELFLKGDDYESSDEMDKFVDWWSTVGRIEVVGCEVPLALMEGGKPLVCGTIDFIGKTKAGYAIIDWKRTCTIDDNGFGKKGTGLLSHLDDTKLNRYRLQLSIYAELLLREHNIDAYDHLYLVKVHGSLECPEVVPALPLREEACSLLDGLCHREEVVAQPL